MKLEVFGMNWKGLYIVSPKPGHVLMKENKKLIIKKCKRTEAIYEIVENEKKDTLSWRELSYYCAFSFISTSDTVTYYLGSCMNSDTIYMRKDNVFFAVDPGFIESLRGTFTDKEQEKIAGSLPPLPQKTKHPVPNINH
ncbi:MAG TPA: hypothetical protein VFJ43_05600 [Bacteroidia bacterium]|nr:hypothetical protein [Bacteroidia bacterium]